MRPMFKTFSLGAVLAVALAGCANVANGPNDFDEPELRFPIAVTPHMETMQVPFTGARSALAADTDARLQQFVSEYLQQGNGKLSIAVPRGAGGAASYFTDRLVQMGVPGTRILTMVDDSLPANGTVELGYIRYSAEAPSCGVWDENVASTSANHSAPNFGCAQRANLAAMVADKRDLLTPEDIDQSDVQRRMTVVEKYRAGEVTQANKNTTEQSAAISAVGGGN